MSRLEVHAKKLEITSATEAAATALEDSARTDTIAMDNLIDDKVDKKLKTKMDKILQEMKKGRRKKLSGGRHSSTTQPQRLVTTQMAPRTGHNSHQPQAGPTTGPRDHRKEKTRTPRRSQQAKRQEQKASPRQAQQRPSRQTEQRRKRRLEWHEVDQAKRAQRQRTTDLIAQAERKAKEYCRSAYGFASNPNEPMGIRRAKAITELTPMTTSNNRAKWLFTTSVTSSPPHPVHHNFLASA